MAIFFTSDTHFNQERTFKYSMRGMYFRDLQAMNEEMVRRWNETVKPEDTVYHLGDFGDFNFLEKLNGRIVLLWGNYERDKINVPTAEQVALLCDFETGKSLHYHPSKDEDFKEFKMVHEPSHVGDFHGFYLFGHIHEKQKVKKRYVPNGEFPNRDVYGLNVGVDCHNFTPVSMETVNFYRNAIENVYDEECFNQF